MSCNGCRALRKGCSDKCMLRQCLGCIECPQAQSHATLFVAKFFGRASLLSFLSQVSQPHRSSLFRSLLFEAVGRTLSPLNGAVGLLWSGKWRLCQAAVETVLHGGTIHALPEPDYCLGPPLKRSKVEPPANLDLSLSSADSDTTSLGSVTVDCRPHHTPPQPHPQPKLLQLFF